MMKNLKKLIILIGAPSSGKSTWIDKLQLSGFTVSPDSFRLQLSPIVTDEQCNRYIDQSKSKEAWELTMKTIELRMQYGLLTVVDATHTKLFYFDNYKKLCDKYGYEMEYKKFTQVSLLDLLIRNKHREDYRRVPEDVIERFYNQANELEIPEYCKEFKTL